jgi:hypothetical protein
MKKLVFILICVFLTIALAQAQPKAGAPTATVAERAALKTERLGKLVGINDPDQLGRFHEAAEEYYKKLDEGMAMPNLTEELKKVKYLRANQNYESRIKSILAPEHHNKFKQFQDKEKANGD